MDASSRSTPQRSTVQSKESARAPAEAASTSASSEPPKRVSQPPPKGLASLGKSGKRAAPSRVSAPSAPDRGSTKAPSASTSSADATARPSFSAVAGDTSTRSSDAATSAAESKSATTASPAVRKPGATAPSREENPQRAEKVEVKPSSTKDASERATGGARVEGTLATNIMDGVRPTGTGPGHSASRRVPKTESSPAVVGAASSAAGGAASGAAAAADASKSKAQDASGAAADTFGGKTETTNVQEAAGSTIEKAKHEAETASRTVADVVGGVGNAVGGSVTLQDAADVTADLTKGNKGTSSQASTGAAGRVKDKAAVRAATVSDTPINVKDKVGAPSAHVSGEVVGAVAGTFSSGEGKTEASEAVENVASRAGNEAAVSSAVGRKAVIEAKKGKDTASEAADAGVTVAGRAQDKPAGSSGKWTGSGAEGGLWVGKQSEPSTPPNAVGSEQTGGQSRGSTAGGLGSRDTEKEACKQSDSFEDLSAQAEAEVAAAAAEMSIGASAVICFGQFRASLRVLIWIVVVLDRFFLIAELKREVQRGFRIHHINLLLLVHDACLCKFRGLGWITEC
jgi:hypothetical protein